MLHFDRFVARHGEVAAQAMLENIERFNGIRHDAFLALAERWARVIAAEQAGDTDFRRAA